MNKYRRPILDKNLFLTNPLTNMNFQVLVRKRTDTKVFKSEDDILLPNEYELEVEPVVRVYKKSDYRVFVARLSPGAKSLFLHIIYETEYGLDYLWINRKRYMDENLVKSVNTYKAAIVELCRYNVICPTMVRDVYWINPRLFFCGSRVKKYPMHVVVINEKKENRIAPALSLVS
jgi:hypothetical protein